MRRAVWIDFYWLHYIIIHRLPHQIRVDFICLDEEFRRGERNDSRTTKGRRNTQNAGYLTWLWSVDYCLNFAWFSAAFLASIYSFINDKCEVKLKRWRWRKVAEVWTKTWPKQEVNGHLGWLAFWPKPLTLINSIIY